MFDAKKKERALEAVNALCLDCREGEHSDDCPLSKAIEAVRSLPTA